MRTTYFDTLRYFQKFYGTKDRICVFFQVGKFYEMYTKYINWSTSQTESYFPEDSSSESQATKYIGANPEISTILGIKHNPVKNQDYHMMGIPVDSSLDYIIKLINYNYIVILINQENGEIDGPTSHNNNKLNTPEILEIINRNEKNVKRYVKSVHTPGTSLYYESNGYYDQTASEFNKNGTLEKKVGYLTAIYINKTKARVNSYARVIPGGINISIANVNPISGISNYFSISNSHDDINRHLDESYRFLHAFPPSEITVSSHCENTDHVNEILNKLELNSDFYTINTKWVENIPPVYFDTGYRKGLFNKCYGESGISGNFDPDERSGIAIAQLLQFIYERNETLLQFISPPKLWDATCYLTLDSNTLQQLDIITHSDLGKKGIPRRYLSVFNLINHTVTYTGSRLLRERLTNPINNREILEFRYNCISELSKSSVSDGSIKLFEIIRNLLSKCPNFEYLHHKIDILELEPCELLPLNTGYKSVLNLIRSINSVEISGSLIPDNFETNLTECMEKYTRYIDLIACDGLRLKGLTCNPFKSGCYPEIDIIDQECKTITNLIRELISQLSKLIDQGDDCVKLKESDEFMYLIITKRRYEILQRNFKLSIKLSDDSLLRFSDLRIKKTSTGKGSKTLTIECPLLDKFAELLNTAYKKLGNTIPHLYRRFLQEFANGSAELFKQMETLTSELDVYQSLTRVAKKYNYRRPVIIGDSSGDSSGESSGDSSGGDSDCEILIDIEGLRHPLSEHLNSKTPYIPHDLIFRQGCSGIIIYGINGSGKSVLMKSLGIAITLAQMGCYVPVKRMRFKLYDRIMTRIIGNDNMHENKSSYQVEIYELDAVLRRSNGRTLALGDEICHGTENISATALTASSIEWLIDLNASFIMTTHLHELTNIQPVSDLIEKKCIQVKHIEVEAARNYTIIKRILKPGSGPSGYGIEVARQMGLPSKFIENAIKVKNYMIGKPETIVGTKKNKYSKNRYRSQMCEVCKTQVSAETHHIAPQRDADENGFINGHHKNHPGNLIDLCKVCHMKTEHVVDGQRLVITSRYSYEFIDAC